MCSTVQPHFIAVALWHTHPGLVVFFYPTAITKRFAKFRINNTCGQDSCKVYKPPKNTKNNTEEYDTATITSMTTENYHTIRVPWQAVADAATSRRAPILVTGNNVEVTEPLKEYVEKKMANVLDKVTRTTVESFVEKRGLFAFCSLGDTGGF